MTTTIVNTPRANVSSGSNLTGLLVAVIVFIIVGALFFYYGLPYFSQMMNKGVQINVPKDINVNIKQSK